MTSASAILGAIGLLLPRFRPGFLASVSGATVGFGIAAYGLAYFLIHDVYIHRRFKWLRDIEHPYFYAIRRAHKIHHKHLGKEHGECFGMLLVPIRFYIESAKQYKQRA